MMILQKCPWSILVLWGDLRPGLLIPPGSPSEFFLLSALKHFFMKKYLSNFLKVCLACLFILGLTSNSRKPAFYSIILVGHNNRYVSSEDGSWAGMTCNRTIPNTWEMFHMEKFGVDQVAFENQGRYVSSENGARPITCNRTVRGDWETFFMIQNNDGTYSFRGSNVRFISSENGGSPMTCNRQSVGDWEKFTIIYSSAN
jgi:hypothetical protein